MPAKADAFCDRTKQQRPGTRGEYVRACVDSLALAYRKTLEGLEDVLGRRIGVIHIVGGGTQNELLNQMTADACRRPVLAGPVEATALGNVLVQARALDGSASSLEELRARVAAAARPVRYLPR